MDSPPMIGRVFGVAVGVTGCTPTARVCLVVRGNGRNPYYRMLRLSLRCDSY